MGRIGVSWTFGSDLVFHFRAAGCGRVLEPSFGLAALHDLECVDPGVQLPGVNQAPQDVVVEVAEPQGGPP